MLLAVGCPVTLLLWGRGSAFPANARSCASLHQASTTERGCRSICERRSSASRCACASRSSFLCSAVQGSDAHALGRGTAAQAPHQCPLGPSLVTIQRPSELFRDRFPLCVFIDEMTQASSSPPLPSRLCPLLCVCVGIQTSSVAWKLGEEAPDAVLTLKSCICGFCGWWWFIFSSQAFDPPCLDLWQFLPSLPWCAARGRAVSKSTAAACSRAGLVQSVECSPPGRVPCCLSPAAQRNAALRKPLVPKGQEGAWFFQVQSSSAGALPWAAAPVCGASLHLPAWDVGHVLVLSEGTFPSPPACQDVFLIQRWKGKHEFGNDALEFANKFAMQVHCLRELGNV